MAKFKFEEPFSLEVGEDTYTGMFSELTKAEKKELNAKQKELADFTKTANKMLNEIKTLERKKDIKENLEEWAEVEKLNDKIDFITNKLEKLTDTMDAKGSEDTIYESRLDLSVKGDDKDAIMKLGEKYSFKKVFETIQEDIAEKKK